jgi:hypothetical protein
MQFPRLDLIAGHMKHAPSGQTPAPVKRETCVIWACAKIGMVPVAVALV